jgi:ribulose bisphosphate carboxylase small subunit
MHNLDHALTRIEMEYREMPDLKLTFWQARRLWNLDDEVCEKALAELVDCKFLHRTADGRYIRRGVDSVRLAS